jgi:shikimate kinase
MFIYVVGPSGVGKTGLCKAVSDGSQIIHVNLEALVSQRNGRAKIPDLLQQNGAGWLWDQCNKIIEEITGRYKFHKSKIIIDVGSTVLASNTARAFLAEQNTVAVVQTPGEVFIKLRQNRSTQKINYHDWEQVEYSPERRKLYDSCKVKVDISDLSEAEAVEKFRAGLGEPESDSPGPQPDAQTPTPQKPFPEPAKVPPRSATAPAPKKPAPAPAPAPVPQRPAPPPAPAPQEPEIAEQPSGATETEYVFVNKPGTVVEAPLETEADAAEPEIAEPAAPDSSASKGGALSSAEEAGLQKAKEAMEEIYKNQPGPPKQAIPQAAAIEPKPVKPAKPSAKPARAKKASEPLPFAFWIALAGCAMPIVATYLFISSRNYVISAIPAGIGLVLGVTAFIFNKWHGPLKVKIAAAAPVILGGLALVFPAPIFIASIIFTGVFCLIELKGFVDKRGSVISSGTFYAVLAGYAVAVVLAAMLFGENFFNLPEDEARNNLLGYQKAQMQYFEKHHNYATNFKDLNWWPSNPDRYTYYISPQDCFRNNSSRYKLPSGIVPFVSKDGYLFVATGNRDRDPAPDVWAIKPGSKPEHLLID